MDASLSPPPEEPRLADGQVDQWLNQAREGSQSALGQALEGVRGYLLLVANRALDHKLKAKVGASDLVQDTFADAQRDFEQFRGTTRQDFHAWLVGILANRLANTVRHYRLTAGRDVDRELPPDAVELALALLRDRSATPGAVSIEHEEQRRVQLALARMSEHLRSVLIERTWQGASFAEIGARRNISPGAARKAWARAVRDMQRRLLELE
jgi:RNA polymerase sigma-70 factor (ECF subfamily)